MDNMEKNTTPFNAADYDKNVRKVIPFYDTIYAQMTDLISVYCGDRSISLLDTGCGSGSMGAAVLGNDKFDISELVLCDPSEGMLSITRERFGDKAEYRCIGSEQLDYEERFDVVTAIQCHHYYSDKTMRELAVRNCFRALKKGGLFICFENTAPFSEQGRDILLRRIERFGINAGRTPEEAAAHSARYGKEYFPITVPEHIEVLNKAGFSCAELFWASYMQCGFYAVK